LSYSFEECDTLSKQLCYRIDGTKSVNGLSYYLEMFPVKKFE